MLYRLINKFSNFLLIVAIAFTLILCSNDSPGQSLWKINSNNPSGGSSTTTNVDQSSGNPNSAVFIIAGLVVGGYVLYRYVLNPKHDEDTTGTDQSASILIPKNSQFHKEMTNLAEVQKSEPPVNVYLGISRDYYINREKTYILGVSVNF